MLVAWIGYSHYFEEVYMSSELTGRVAGIISKPWLVGIMVSATDLPFGASFLSFYRTLFCMYKRKPQQKPVCISAKKTEFNKNGNI